MKLTETDIAYLAANNWPKLYKTNPAKAIKEAIRHIPETEELEHVSKEEIRRLVRMFPPRKKIDPGQHVTYTSGIKGITDEKNWERALPKFKRFMAAKFTKDGEAEIRMADHEGRGFTVNQIVKYAHDYAPWWTQEKSNSARKSALANKKQRGRVKRPKSDLRFKKNRKHKQGYCQKCGKRVRQRERLCDDCVSGKPQLITMKAPL